VAQSVSRELEDGPRLLSRLLVAYDFSEEKDHSQLFRNIKMQFPYSKLIYISVLDEDGRVAKNISNIKLGINREYIDKRRLGETQFIEFSENIIVYRGEPYHDSMNINSLVPIFIDLYENMKVRMNFFMEMDVSSILYDARFSLLNFDGVENPDYTVSIYTQDMELVETTENYPLIKIKTLSGDKDNESFLADKELTILRTGANYHRINKSVIELYNLNSMGYVIKSSYPYSLILTKVKYLNALIVSIGLIILVLIITIANYSIHYRQIREREILLQIETIQAKLNPHFLFNTLNSMVGLVFDRKYKKLLSAFKTLSALLRSSIEVGPTGTLLSEEMEYIKNYIEIQKLRYEDAFDYFYEIEDESLLDVYIPHFSIQPIVENCFVHAIAVNEDREKKIYIKITITRKERLMYIDIKNNGPCPRETKVKLQKIFDNYEITAAEGHLGLALINKEIKLLYGRQAGLEMTDAEREDIFSIRLKLPA
jgi:sensor histidine kinase YesM